MQSTARQCVALQSVAITRRSMQAEINDLKVNAAGDRAASCAADGFVRTWSLCRATLGHPLCLVQLDDASPQILDWHPLFRNVLAFGTASNGAAAVGVWDADADGGAVMLRPGGAAAAAAARGVPRRGAAPAPAAADSDLSSAILPPSPPCSLSLLTTPQRSAGSCPTDGALDDRVQASPSSRGGPTAPCSPPSATRPSATSGAGPGRQSPQTRRCRWLRSARCPPPAASPRRRTRRHRASHGLRSHTPARSPATRRSCSRQNGAPTGAASRRPAATAPPASSGRLPAAAAAAAAAAAGGGAVRSGRCSASPWMAPPARGLASWKSCRCDSVVVVTTGCVQRSPWEVNGGLPVPVARRPGACFSAAAASKPLITFRSAARAVPGRRGESSVPAVRDAAPLVVELDRASFLPQRDV